jgi:putative nucleotidyltransferase with HDIG domain
MGSSVFRNPAFKKEMDILWKHSMAVAFISQEIAAKCEVDVEHAFLCGLVHDIGKPFLVDVISKVLKKQPKTVVLPDEHLLAILDQLHQAVGGILARVWKFSDSVTKAVSHHHEYQTIEGEPKLMANLVHTADLVAHSMEIGLRLEPPAIGLSESFQHLDVSTETSQEIMDTFPEKVQAYLDSIG